MDKAMESVKRLSEGGRQSIETIKEILTNSGNDTSELNDTEILTAVINHLGDEEGAAGWIVENLLLGLTSAEEEELLLLGGSDIMDSGLPPDSPHGSPLGPPPESPLGSPGGSPPEAMAFDPEAMAFDPEAMNLLPILPPPTGE